MKMDAELRRGGWGPTTSRLGWARTNDHQAPERWIAAGTAAEPYVPGAIHVSGRPKQPTHEHPGSAPEWLDVDATPRRAGAIHVRGQRSQMTVDTSDASRLPGSPVTNLVVYLPKWSVKSGQGQLQLRDAEGGASARPLPALSSLSSSRRCCSHQVP